MRRASWPVVLALVAAPGVAAAQTFVIGADARPRVEGGRIVTDAFDDSSGTLVTHVRHFGYRFQLDPFDPYFTQEPGFNAVAGSGLTPSSQLSFSVDRHLAYWSGLGGVSFTTPPQSEALRFSFGAASVTISGSSAPQSGFVLGNVSSTGALHRHLNAFLLPGAAAVPSDGVYFTNIRLHSSDGGILPSDSLYLVYNNGASDDAFRAALEYLSAPLPGDANFDGVVNLQDFNVLASNFGTSDRAWYHGDFNGDRTVNLQDFNLLASQFGQSTAAAVPEPAACFLLLPLMLATRRRARVGGRDS